MQKEAIKDKSKLFVFINFLRIDNISLLKLKFRHIKKEIKSI